MQLSRFSQIMVVVGVLVAISGGALADAKAKVIAVVNKAAWCSVCKANGERVSKTLTAASQDGRLAVVMNDVTSAETTRTSAVGLKATGLAKAMRPYTAAGVIYLFDAKSKRPLRQVTVANTDEEIGMVISLAKQAAGR